MAGFSHALGAALGSKGPHMIHMRVATGTMEGLGRPTIAPPEVARRFRGFLAEG